MQEQVIKIRYDNLTTHNQLEIIRRLMWNNEFRVRDYDFGHFEFMVNGESVTIAFEDFNTLIITSYLSYNNFNTLYKTIYETIEEFQENENLL